MSMESEGRDLLMRRLDDCLQQYAEKVMEPRDEKGLPIIGNIYLLQGMAEVHYLMKAEHPITPKEVSALLKFEDPLAVVSACWEENPERYSFDICRIMEEHHMDKRFPLSESAFAREEKPSLREQLHAAMRESRRQQKPEQPTKGNRGGDAI